MFLQLYSPVPKQQIISDENEILILLGEYLVFEILKHKDEK
jgi:hypothetical protein